MKTHNNDVNNKTCKANQFSNYILGYFFELKVYGINK